MDLGLALAGEDDIHMVRGKGRDDVGHMVHTTDVTQKCLIDAACEVEAEVGILSETHIGEVLVRHRLDDGTGHLRHTALGVVAVEEFAPLPLVVDGLHLVGDNGEQFVGEVA